MTTLVHRISHRWGQSITAHHKKMNKDKCWCTKYVQLISDQSNPIKSDIHICGSRCMQNIFTEQQRFVLFFLCCRGKNVGECPKSVKRKALTEAGLLPTKIPWNSLEKKQNTIYMLKHLLPTKIPWNSLGRSKTLIIPFKTFVTG